MYFDDKFCTQEDELCQDREYHKYQRWAWYWKQRLDSSGNRRDLSQVVETHLAASASKKTMSGDYNSEDYDWKNITQTTSVSGYNGMGRAAAMAFHPTNENIWYLGAPNGGIWKTEDGGNNWIALGDDLPFVSTGNIIVNQDDPNEIFISVGDSYGWWNYGLGIYKSNDAGLTWTPTDFANEFTDFFAVLDMRVSPVNSSEFFVATGDGLYKTTDKFQTVDNVLTSEVTNVRIHPTDPSIVYASRRTSSNSQIWKSTDGGENWSSSSNFNHQGAQWVEIKISISEVNPDFVFATTSTNKCYRSTDAGQTWQFMSDIDEFGVLIHASDNAERIYSGWLNIYESNDGGDTWDKLSHWYAGTGVPAVHADQRKVFKNPLQPHLVYFCNDGGIYTYNMDTENFTDYSDGLIIMQYYKVASAQDDPVVIIGGTQDNGGRRRDANGSWRATNGGDAMEIALDPDNNNILFTTYINGQMYRSMGPEAG